MATKLTSLRMDEDTFALLESLKVVEGRPKSKIIRDALLLYVQTKHPNLLEKDTKKLLEEKVESLLKEEESLKDDLSFFVSFLSNLDPSLFIVMEKWSADEIIGYTRDELKEKIIIDKKRRELYLPMKHIWPFKKILDLLKEEGILKRYTIKDLRGYTAMFCVLDLNKLEERGFEMPKKGERGGSF